jgi:hypothetical protein
LAFLYAAVPHQSLCAPAAVKLYQRVGGAVPWIEMSCEPLPKNWLQIWIGGQLILAPLQQRKPHSMRKCRAFKLIGPTMALRLG